MKRSLGYFLAVLLVSTLAGAEEKSPKGRADQTSEAAAFPSIAMDQTRPGQYGSNLVDDPGEWDPASGSYTINQCNCKRECPEVNKYQCKLTSDPFKACKMTNGMCGACTKDCGA